MKKFSTVLFAVCLSLFVIAQGNSKGKDKDKQKDKSKKEKVDRKKNKDNEDKDAGERAEHEKKVWDGTYTNYGTAPKPSKRQPARVRSSFQRDYPGATGVSWSKYRGDWTATFGNGRWMSTAVYHANGDRRDTRTPVNRTEVPGRVLDSIFKKRPERKLGDIIKIELPQSIGEIFRIKDITGDKPVYLYYNREGREMKYDY